jgi:hypothetical protein
MLGHLMHRFFPNLSTSRYVSSSLFPTIPAYFACSPAILANSTQRGSWHEPEQIHRFNTLPLFWLKCYTLVNNNVDESERESGDLRDGHSRITFGNSERESFEKTNRSVQSPLWPFQQFDLVKPQGRGYYTYSKETHIYIKRKQSNASTTVTLNIILRETFLTGIAVIYLA